MMADKTIIEGQLKYRDRKKWKSRWCVISKLSPVADCLQLQFYKNVKDKQKNRLPKASLSLETLIAEESGFTMDKESHTLAVICRFVTVILAFENRERLIHWQVKVATNLGIDHQWLVQLIATPAKSKLQLGPVKLHLVDGYLSLTTSAPPKLLQLWEVSSLRRFGVVGSKFAFEGGSRCGNQGTGLHVVRSSRAEDIGHCIRLAAEGRLQRTMRPLQRHVSDKMCMSAWTQGSQPQSPTGRCGGIRTSDSCFSFLDAGMSRRASCNNAPPPPPSSSQDGSKNAPLLKNLPNHKYDVPFNLICSQPSHFVHRATIPIRYHLSKSRSSCGLRCYLHHEVRSTLSPQYDVPKFSRCHRQYANLPLASSSSLSEARRAPIYANVSQVCCPCCRGTCRARILDSEYMDMGPTVFSAWASMPRACSQKLESVSRRCRSVESSRALPPEPDNFAEEVSEELSAAAYSPSHASVSRSWSSWESWNALESMGGSEALSRKKCVPNQDSASSTDSGLGHKKSRGCLHSSLPRFWVKDDAERRIGLSAWRDSVLVNSGTQRPASSTSGASDLSDYFDSLSVGSSNK